MVQKLKLKTLILLIFFISLPLFSFAQACNPDKLKSVQYGQKGDEIKNVQACLIQAGYNIPSGATGYYGKETRKAVKEFYAEWYKKPRKGLIFGPQAVIELKKRIVNKLEKQKNKKIVLTLPTSTLVESKVNKELSKTNTENFANFISLLKNLLEIQKSNNLSQNFSFITSSLFSTTSLMNISNSFLLDTFIKKIEIFDVDNKKLILEKTNSFQKTKDNNYITISTWYRKDENNLIDKKIFLLIKFNSQGDVIFVRQVNDIFISQDVNNILNDELLLKVDTDGNYILAGTLKDYEKNYVSFVKFDSQGNFVFRKNIKNSENNLRVLNFIPTNDKGYIFVFISPAVRYISLGNDNGNNDSEIIKLIFAKLNNSGDLVWSKKYQFKDHEPFISDFVNLDNNNYLLLGNLFKKDFSFLNVFADNLSFVLSLDDEGNINWIKGIKLQNENSFFAAKINKTNDNNFLLGGYFFKDFEDFLSGKIYSFVSKIDSRGNVVDGKKISILNEVPYFMLYDFLPSDNGYVFLGKYFENKDDLDSNNLNNYKTVLVVFKLNQNLDNLIFARKIKLFSNSTGLAFLEKENNGYFLVSDSFDESLSRSGLSLFLAKLDSLGNCSNCNLIQSASTLINNAKLTNENLNFISENVFLFSENFNELKIEEMSHFFKNLSFRVKLICPK